MKDDDAKLAARVTHLQDQCRSAVESLLPDIKRIGESGPDSSRRDADIVRIVFCHVAGEIYARRGESTHAD